MGKNVSHATYQIFLTWILDSASNVQKENTLTLSIENAWFLSKSYDLFDISVMSEL